MTTAAKGADTSAISYCLVKCSFFFRAPALLRCGVQQFSSTPQVAGCIKRVPVATPFFVRHSAAPGPYLIPALASPSPQFGEHDVCSVTC